MNRLGPAKRFATYPTGVIGRNPEKAVAERGKSKNCPSEHVGRGRRILHFDNRSR